MFSSKHFENFEKRYAIKEYLYDKNKDVTCARANARDSPQICS